MPTAQIKSLADKAGVSVSTMDNAWNNIKDGLKKSGMKEDDPMFYGTLVNTLKKKFDIKESLSEKLLSLFEAEYIKEPNGVKVLKNDDRVFALRREVIDIIYKLKKINPDLPRIQVRIVDTSEYGKLPYSDEESQVLGVAWLGNNAIFIDSDRAIKGGHKIIYVVVHEIIHAVYKVNHVADKSDIMYAAIRDRDDEYILSEFKKWTDRYNTGKIKSNGYIDDSGKLIKFER